MAFAQRILVVENEYVLAHNLKRFLDRRSADVRIARDGEDAIALMESFVPDVVVLDHHLPGINGLQTYSEIARRRERSPRCVMITGYPLERVAGPARALGIHHLLCKPFGLWELRTLIELCAAAPSSRAAH